MTLMHEHVCIFSPGFPAAFPHLYDRAAILNAATQSLGRARAAGVGTIVDVTTVDLGRDPELVIRAAAAADINVVMCTGIWVDVPRYVRGRGPDDAARLFIQEIEDGIQGTDVKAGIIKVASDEEVTPAEEIVLRGAARAARATGIPITTHSMTRTTSALRQVEILSEEGVPMDRVVIGHSTTTDRDYLDKLYGTGCTVGWDTFAYVADGELVEVVATLAEYAKAYPERTVLSNDSSPFADWEPMAVPYDYGNVMELVIPALGAAGVAADEIQQIMVHNPARLLTPAGPKVPTQTAA
jgi:phosphotriesterase-related protein